MPNNSFSANRITEKDWALSLDVGSDHEPKHPPVAVHYVVDNSSSMGTMTKQVQEIFSEMVDSVATAPCSMTVFHQKAKILSSTITTGQEMRDLVLPPQGSTNIPAGIEKALGVIRGHEMKAKARAKKHNEHVARTHHILILLSDGEHNAGPSPSQVFPTLGRLIPEDTKLSVIIVGYSASSNTSMGMLLKKSIESSAFDPNVVQTIYFATTRTSLRTALTSLETGLNAALKGTFHEIEADTPSLVDSFGSDASSKLRVHLRYGSRTVSLLCCGDSPPTSLILDGETVQVHVAEEISVMHLSKLIQGLIDRTKIQVVASKNRASLITNSVKRLDSLVGVLESKSKDKKDLQLRSATPKQRLQQYRDIRTVCHGARSLRNQVLDIANFSNKGSEDQAAFLNGRDKKYAKKALRRAAKNAGGIIDPKEERKAILKDLNSDSFREGLRSAMTNDVLTNLVRLSGDQFDNALIPWIRSIKGSHVMLAQEIRAKASHANGSDTFEIDELGLSPRATTFFESGKLADYLNDFFHGKRHSYLSLSSPWQHLEEWSHFGEQSFESTWEMLMYAGFLGYPILLERCAASQMNPYLIQVKGVRPSLADTASICCANQAEVPVYGPEGGEPIQDVLVLIDPSMPRTSKMICSNALLGEKFTSATTARDLHMYSGVNMRIALHANSLFHLLAESEQVVREGVIADLRRALLGRAFMCADCGFGPVDHFACSDLHAHHGQSMGGSVTINNACPRCSWFSHDLDDWEPWDGTVCEEFITSTLEEQKSKEKLKRAFLSEAKTDLALHILYSFRQMCSTSIQQEYSKLVELVAGAHNDLSANTGIEGMSQVLLALAHPFENEKHLFTAEKFESDKCLISIIQEACAREARQRFRMKSGGDKEKARALATEFITKLLGIKASTAPFTLPQMESEPLLENVRLDCDDSFQVNASLGEDEISWVRGIARRWCRVWSFAKGLHQVVDARAGGWRRLADDMETGYFNYQDVVQSLKRVQLTSPREALGMDASELKSLFLRIGVAATLSGAAGKPCRTAVLDDKGVLHEAAREMRMLIYFERVREKMATWKTKGEQETFLRARTADIVQYADLVGAKPHVHGFDKQTFWGLWSAAKNSKNKGKIEAFLRTANPEFCSKHI